MDRWKYIQVKKRFAQVEKLHTHRNSSCASLVPEITSSRKLKCYKSITEDNRAKKPEREILTHKKENEQIPGDHQGKNQFRPTEHDSGSALWCPIVDRSSI